MIAHYGYCPICDDIIAFGCMGPFFCPKEHDTLEATWDDYYKFKNTGIKTEELELLKKGKSKNRDLFSMNFSNAHPKIQEKVKKAIKIIEDTRKAIGN